MYSNTMRMNQREDVIQETRNSTQEKSEGNSQEMVKRGPRTIAANRLGKKLAQI